MIQIEEEKFKQALRELRDLQTGLMADIVDPKLTKEKFRNQVSLNSVNKVISLFKNEPNKNTSY